VVAGRTALVAPSGDGHCVVTKGNILPCELEMKREIIMRRVSSSVPWRGGVSGNQASRGKRPRDDRLDHPEPPNRTSPAATRATCLNTTRSVRRPRGAFLESHSNPLSDDYAPYETARTFSLKGRHDWEIGPGTAHSSSLRWAHEERMVAPIASLDREDKGRNISVTSLNTRSPWWQVHPPMESTFLTRTDGVESPSNTSCFPEWMALRVLGLVRRSKVLVYLGELIKL